MELSSAALGQGWIGIETSQVQSIGSAELEGFLREDFYDGRSLPQMATEPLLYSCVTLVIVVYLVFVMKEEIGDEWRRLRRAVPEPEWRWESGGDRLANQEGLTARIRSHIVRWNSETKFLFNWINFRAAISRHHSINQPVNIERLRGDDEPVSTEVQQESSNPQHLPNPLSSQASKALSNTRPIFRGSSTSHAARSESKPWEESEWID
ncbi:hypothetical protein [Edaphobacter aggregans]|uniref:hypothetical protein n=1 Tax=Edaphobacter aggregans TaxID=570835 RepID=UPI0012FBABA4|nr:hypothetical protein [Edaphobacter aggregans]